MTSEKQRKDGRALDELRPVTIRPGFTRHAEGSVLMEMGDTKVICTATVEERVPPFLQKSGKGWVTAEYGMLPRATTERTQREASRGKQGGRTMEIQRLIGRSLRAAVDFELLGERTLWIDCDVIQADGGTRTASITGGFVAMSLALAKMYLARKISSWPIQESVAAVSVGMIDGRPCLDLSYEEDSRAEVDMNVIANDKLRYIEVQGTAEGKSFSQEDLDGMMSAARAGIATLIERQNEILTPTLNEVKALTMERLNRKVGSKR